jgi:hypothetical protein
LGWQKGQANLTPFTLKNELHFIEISYWVMKGKHELFFAIKTQKSFAAFETGFYSLKTMKKIQTHLKTN